MSVVFQCPPVGPPPPEKSECGDVKNYSWTSDGEGYLYFYVPGMNKSLVNFRFFSEKNNGSVITVDLIYVIDGVETLATTWFLGDLAEFYTDVFHYIDFETNLENFDFFLKLQISTQYGTSGEFDVEINCNVEVTNQLFCTGVTINQQTRECICDNSDYVRIYGYKEPSLNYSFQYSRSTWYLDPQLSIQAPCGLYMSVGDGTPVVYDYDCEAGNYTDIVYTCGNCAEISCNNGSYSTSHTGYTKNNPYIDGTQGITLNGLVYSIECFNLKLNESEVNIYVPITFSYSGPADDVCFTITDTNPQAGNIGVLSYSEFSPASSPFFQAISPQTLVRFERGQTTKTIWVIPPLSRVMKVRMAVGQQLDNVKRTVTTTATFGCGVLFYSYLAGLHTYSAYDSIKSPKLQTNLYSFTNRSSWGIKTIVFADRLCTQPAYPYYYGIENTVYKVGDPFLREVGVVKDVKVKKRPFKRPKVTVRIYQGNWMETLPNGEKRSKACVTPFMSMGFITKILSEYSLPKPDTYLYFMGYSATEDNGGSKVKSNNDSFSIFDGERQIPVTGFQHALYRLEESWRQGFAVYLSNFGEEVQFVYKNISSLSSTSAGGIGVSLGLGVLAAALIYQGLATTYSAAILCVTWFNTFIVNLAFTLGVSTGGLGFLVAAAILIIISIFVIFKKAKREDCKIFYIRYNNAPYLNVNSPLWMRTDKSGTYEGYYCDGGYFYTVGPVGNESSTIGNSFVKAKELSYSEDNGVRTNSITPDNPTKVVDFGRLLFLPYVSGRPETYI